MSTTQPKIVVLAEFESPEMLLAAARGLRDTGYSQFDCHSPFPIHGMDGAMGMRRSRLGYLVGIMGVMGLAGSMLLQWWTSAVDYPLVISGKPYFSFQAFIPVTFALTVLLAAFGAFFGMLHLNRLPRWHDPLFGLNRFSKFSNAGFFISLPSSDPLFDRRRAEQFLRSIGAREIEIVEDQP